MVNLTRAHFPLDRTPGRKPRGHGEETHQFLSMPPSLTWWWHLRMWHPFGSVLRMTSHRHLHGKNSFLLAVDLLFWMWYLKHGNLVDFDYFSSSSHIFLKTQWMDTKPVAWLTVSCRNHGDAWICCQCCLTWPGPDWICCGLRKLSWRNKHKVVDIRMCAVLNSFSLLSPWLHKKPPEVGLWQLMTLILEIIIML